MARAETVLIAAGGTGGHIFPGLAAAQALHRQGVAVEWLGSLGGMEATLVPQRGLKTHLIRIAGVRGKGPLAQLAAPLRLLGALWQTWGVFRRVRPHCVLGMGGFAAGPAGLMAWLCRVPLVIHEQNAVPGLTNRWLARLAARVLAGFEGAFPATSGVAVVGNPVRDDLACLPSPAERGVGTRSPRLLVLGGSRGAQALNECVPAALGLMAEAQRPTVLHQCGAGKRDECVAAYARAGVAADVREFIDDMAAAYSATDLVVARAGALTLAELACVGVGAVLVPYPHAVDDHQTANAEGFRKVGAALVMGQQSLTPEQLTSSLTELLGNPTRLLEMAAAARQLAHPDAAAAVARACIEVMRK